MPKFVYVPQGCYAEIKEESEDIVGLCTSGMGPCCHIIIANRNNGHSILCHADGLTDLTHAGHGVPAWIEKVCPDGNYQNLLIDIGENPNNPRDYTPVYYNQITQCLVAKNIDINIITSRFSGEGQDGISINKNTSTIELAQYKKIDLRDDLHEKGIELIELKDESGVELESFIIHARNYADNLNKQHNLEAETLKFPPICIFNVHDNRFLNINEIENLYNNSNISQEQVIEWSRVRSLESSSTPGFSVHGEDSESHSNESSNNSIQEDLQIQSDNIETKSQDPQEVDSDEYSTDQDHETVSTTGNPGNKNLTYSEKASIVQTKPKFIDILLNELSANQKKTVSIMKESLNFQKEQSKFEALIENHPKITFMHENDHKSDHSNNIQKLIQMINNEKIDSHTVICLERKEQGENFGMQDVRLLANLIEHNQNNPEEAITIPEKIQNSLIYQDALLFNVARKNGIEVIGIEGKGLEHSKESPEYNSGRETYMSEQIKKITASGRSVIFPVGAAHIDGLKERLPSAQVYDGHLLEAEKIKNTLQRTAELNTDFIPGKIKPKSRSLTI